MKWGTRVICIVVLSMTSVSGAAEDGNSTPLELFNQRILPIFRSEQPSSCVQCHLSSVDLKDYILPSSEQTFVSLRDQGLIDMAAPADSGILKLIRMGDRDPDAGSRLIHEEMRKAELAAFEAWVAACCADRQLRELPRLAPEQLAGPAAADAVIRHARKSRVVDSFVRNVWSQRMRCFPCHTPHEIDVENPLHQAALKTQSKFREELSEELYGRLQIFRKTPEETLQYLIERSAAAPQGHLPMLNLTDATQSLLVRKPLAKIPEKDAAGKLLIPAEGDATVHMGGLKMHPDDQSYKSIIAWIQDYAKVVQGEYTAVEQLPQDNWRPTGLVVRLMEVPEDWSAEQPVQLFVHGRNAEGNGWAVEPLAFTQGTITPRRIVNGTLFLLGEQQRDSHAAYAAGDGKAATALLPPGDYQIRVFVDRHGVLAKDPAAMLTAGDHVGSAVLSKARWREGFKFAETVNAGKLE